MGSGGGSRMGRRDGSGMGRRDGSGRGMGSGDGMGGQGRRSGFGPSTYCICPKCGTKIQHTRGMPCTETKCPKCGSYTIGNEAYNAQKNSTPSGVSQEKIIQSPVIDKTKCTGCGECIEVCPFKAISLKNGKAVIDYSKCNNCNVCIKSCPVNAIE